MFDRIEKMVDDMMGSDDSYLPDIFAESSETIIEIIKEILGDDLPKYIKPCTYSDYFGNKAVGRNAINKIQRAWYYEPEAFTINKKRGILEYRIPDNTWYLYLGADTSRIASQSERTGRIKNDDNES